MFLAFSPPSIFEHAKWIEEGTTTRVVVKLTGVES
jgi:hypothetical protein